MPLILLFFTLPLDQSSTNGPTFSQVSLCCPSISLSLFGAGGVQLISRSVSTLGRVVAHWRGLSRVARVSPCAAQPGTAGGGPAPARPRLGTSTALVATLVTQGRGQWGSHWRRQGQRRRLWRLRQASPAGDPAAPALLDIRLVLVASVTSVYGGRPTQLSPQLTRSSGQGEVAQITQF